MYIYRTITNILNNKMNKINNIMNYHCVGIITSGYLPCPNCNNQIPFEIEIEEIFPPVSYKINRTNDNESTSKSNYATFD